MAEARTKAAKTVAGESNLEVVRRCLEAFESDVEDWRATLAPDFEWMPFEEGSIARGVGAAERVRARWLSSFKDHRIELRDIQSSGDDVLATVSLGGQGAASGVEVGVDLYLHFRLRDGLIVYLYEHTDRHAAMRAAGLTRRRSPPPPP